ncbi:MAG: glycosyltransferase [Actinomycetota bacterium]
MFEEPASPRSPEPFSAILGADALASFNERAAVMRDRLKGRTVWHVNSTSRGGGVAEMLSALLAYDYGIGITNRWLVIDTDDEFIDVTKKIHNRLHGARDDGDLGSDDKQIYERTIAREAEELTKLISADDVVMLHDPQVAGLAPPAKEIGATVFWRSHIGADEPDDVVRGAWTFLRPYVEQADGIIFSREAHVWDDVPRDRVAIIPPCIDAFSAKNKDLTDDDVAAYLTATGFLAGPASDVPIALKPRRRTGEPIDPDTAVVAQVGRWDRLKDPVGVIQGFAEHVAPHTDAHLLLSGPLADQVDDDPEGAEVMQEVLAAAEALSGDVGPRVHVVDIPLDDGDESALLVNAIQRHAAAVVQKSLAEGFGLTVAEAMWKARPVVASRVGGIQDQIEHDRTGLLVDDPRDLAAFGKAVTELLTTRERARTLGENGRESVRDRFLVPAHLMRWYDVLERTLDRLAVPAA